MAATFVTEPDSFPKLLMDLDLCGVTSHRSHWRNSGIPEILRDHQMTWEHLSIFTK